MPSVTLAGLVLSALFMISHTVHATAINLLRDGVGRTAVSSSFRVSAKESSRVGAAPTFPNYASSSDVSGFPVWVFDDGWSIGLGKRSCLLLAPNPSDCWWEAVAHAPDASYRCPTRRPVSLPLVTSRFLRKHPGFADAGTSQD
jgi:hypothetical protein